LTSAGCALRVGKTNDVDALKELEKFHLNNPVPFFWVGEKVSYIDMFAWDYWHLARPLAPHVLDRFQTLAQFKLAFQNVRISAPI